MTVFIDGLRFEFNMPQWQVRRSSPCSARDLGVRLKNTRNGLSKSFWTWHAHFLAPLVRAIHPDFFFRDFELIRYLGDALDSRQAKADTLDFRDMDRKHWRMLHSGLMIRVSHRKARRLACQLLGKPEWTDAAFPAQQGGSGA